MGSTTLVIREQIQGGEDLLKFLPSRGVPVTGAAWAQVEGDGQPYLYIVSPDVDASPLPATRRFVDAFRELAPTWTDPFRQLDTSAVKLVGPSEPVGQVLGRWYQQYNDAVPSVYRGSIPGYTSFVSLDEAYIYPATLFAAPAAPGA